MADPSFTVRSYTFPSVSLESATINDLGHIVGNGYQENMGPNYLVTWSESDGVFVNLGTTFAQNGPFRVNDLGQVTSFDGIDNIKLGTTTPVLGPDGSLVEINGENNLGQFVGYYDEQGVIDSYGKITVLNFPGSSGVVPGAEPGGAVSTSPFAINDVGQVIGIYEDSIGEHGFLYSHGSYSTISIPNSTYVDPTGINDLGEIVGYYKDSSGNDNGFIDLGGKIKTYDVPGAAQTIVSGVNNLGQLVGWYGDITNSAGQYVFVATPKV